MPNVEPVADGAAIPGWAPVIEDPALAALLRPGAVLHRLATGATWAEGPVWVPQDGSVVWSDVVGNRVLRWDPDGRVSVLLADAEFENGHTLDHDGSIMACSHGHRRIERLGLDGTLSPIVDRYQGRRFNSPNDVVVKSDGTIWFTDPPYGITSNREGHQADSEIGDCLVFRFDPRTGELDAVTDWVDEPNGLAFSPDETVLYVSDTSHASHDDGGGNHHIAAFDVVGGRTSRIRGSSTPSTNGCPTASASTSRATSGRRPMTESTSWPPTGGVSAGCRSRSGPRTACSAAPTSIACSSPRRRPST